MIADALGWTLNRVTDEIEPKIAEKPVSSQFLNVEAGQVCGLIQDGVGYRDGEPVITLHMEAYLGAPVVRRRANRGHAALAHEARRRRPRRHRHGVDCRQLDPPGARRAASLHTMRSLPLPSFFGGKLG